jgi:hypothetical protein
VKIALIGGVRDGETVEVTTPPPPVLRLAIPTKIPALWIEAAEALGAEPIQIDTYYLARMVMDFRWVYVERGVYERWR